MNNFLKLCESSWLQKIDFFQIFLRSYEISNIEIIERFLLLTIFTKSSMLDVDSVLNTPLLTNTVCLL